MSRSPRKSSDGSCSRQRTKKKASEPPATGGVKRMITEEARKSIEDTARSTEAESTPLVHHVLVNRPVVTYCPVTPSHRCLLMTYDSRDYSTIANQSTSSIWEVKRNTSTESRLCARCSLQTSSVQTTSCQIFQCHF